MPAAKQHGPSAVSCSANIYVDKVLGLFLHVSAFQLCDSFVLDSFVYYNPDEMAKCYFQHCFHVIRLINKYVQRNCSMFSHFFTLINLLLFYGAVKLTKTKSI